MEKTSLVDDAYLTCDSSDDDDEKATDKGGEAVAKTTTPNEDTSSKIAVPSIAAPQNTNPPGGCTSRAIGNGFDEQLPPELLRELKRNRRRGGRAELNLVEVDANVSAASSIGAVPAAPRESTKRRAAHALRRAGVTKAARRNHHISELLAAARADEEAASAMKKEG